MSNQTITGRNVLDTVMELMSKHLVSIHQTNAKKFREIVNNPKIYGELYLAFCKLVEENDVKLLESFNKKYYLDES